MEERHVTLALAAALRSAAEDKITLVALQPVVEPLRAVKDAAELDLLRRACEITDHAFAATAARLTAGVSERDVAWWLEQAIRDGGGDGQAFDAIVAFGANSAIPHHQPTHQPLAVGDLIKIDFGARYAGYHADMTRTMVLGPAASWQRELYDEVAEIQAAARATCVVGAVPSQLDAQAREAIIASGHSVAHGLGHGVGLEIHEDPFLTPGAAAGPLVESMTVTIEPGIYVANRGGVRIEDTMVMTADGAVPMTATSRELVER
jgi:Xaa-Pro aminopeptidase